MALAPGPRYPGQTDTGDPAYPLGKARNATAFNDGTGTPLEKDWINDVWGFLQALLAAVNITASGDPDEVGASQYLEALISLAALKVAVYQVSGFGVANGVAFDLVQRFQRGGFTLDGNAVELPGAGTYLVIWTGVVQSDAAGNPEIHVSLDSTAGDVDVFDANTTGNRYSTSTSGRVNLTLIKASTVAAADQNVIVKASGSGNLTCLQSALVILKL